VLPTDDELCAIVDGDTRLSYGQLRRAVEHFARILSEEFDAGDVVALIGANSAQWVVAYLGSLAAGLVVTPLNTLATEAEVAKQVTASRAVLMIFDSTVETVAANGAKAAGLDDDAVRALDDVALEVNTPAQFTSRRGDLAVLPYSSGTTGPPKGVMLSHRSLVANLCQLDESLGVTADSVVLGLLPFSHIYGMTVVLNLALRRRASVVIMRSFDVDSLLALIGSQSLTHLPVAPPVMVALAKSPKLPSVDVSSVQLVLSGAAPLDAMLAHAVESRLGCSVRQAYGMTEMSPVSHIAAVDIPNVPARSVGLTVANMSCKLIDTVSGVEYERPTVGVSPAGELWCKGPNVMVGYLDNPTATAEVLDEYGYLHTGDIATIDSEGFVTIVDRMKELIKYKGYQVAPAELEGVLLEHEFIQDAAVVGRSLGNGDEAPHAFIVRTVDADLTESAVADYVAHNVAPYKKIRGVTFVDTIPKTASGKILRRELRARL
jgi:4-coumarate--CoA ligase